MPTEPVSEAVPAQPPAKRPNVLRRLYAWVLSWADSRYGTPALAAISFAESSFFPIPPDVLQIALSVARPRRSFYYATVSAVASVLGAILGYWIGMEFWENCSAFFFDHVPGFTQERFDKVGAWYQDNAFMSIFTAAFTPIPFKVFTIAAGVFYDFVPLHVLLLASALGRSLRFFIVAAVTFYFGKPAKEILEKYFEWITLLLGALLIGGFVVAKFVIG